MNKQFQPRLHARPVAFQTLKQNMCTWRVQRSTRTGKRSSATVALHHSANQPRETFPKIHPFWYRHLSLTYNGLNFNLSENWTSEPRWKEIEGSTYECTGQVVIVALWCTGPVQSKRLRRRSHGRVHPSMYLIPTNRDWEEFIFSDLRQSGKRMPIWVNCWSIQGNGTLGLSWSRFGRFGRVPPFHANVKRCSSWDECHCSSQMCS